MIEEIFVRDMTAPWPTKAVLAFLDISKPQLYLLQKRHNFKIMKFPDTDKQRSKKTYWDMREIVSYIK